MSREIGVCHCGHSMYEHYMCGAPAEMRCMRSACGCEQFADRVFVPEKNWKRSPPNQAPREWGAA